VRRKVPAKAADYRTVEGDARGACVNGDSHFLRYFTTIPVTALPPGKALLSPFTQ
jgi:hypothetical protein